MSVDIAVKKMLSQYSDQMPQVDKVREILQQTALLGLARHQFFEHAAFYGGTALRILYGLDRYSEDLDFSLIRPNSDFDFGPFLYGMNRELAGLGFDLDVKIREKNGESGIWSAFLKANTMTLLLSIAEKKELQGIHPEQKIKIKLEIDTDPPSSHLPLESKLVKNPVPFYVSTYAPADLFAGKMHAALFRRWKNRIKGRDWYDLIWYIQNNIPINIYYLKERMIQLHQWQREDKFEQADLRDLLKRKIDEIDWELAKADVAMFIADKQQLEIWSRQFFHDLTSNLQIFDPTSAT